MLNSLQACRAIAAILVLLFHTSGSIFNLPKYFGHKPFGPVFDFGFAGVDFFFVLSGFIMMHAHADDLGQPRAIGAYWWKRFTRIYPAYWVVLAVLVSLFYLAPHFGAGHERDAGVVVRSVFLIPHPEGQQVLTVAWTLVYEVFFYVLFGLLILNRRIGTALFIGWAILVVAQPAWSGSYLWQFATSDVYIRFFAGIGVAMFLKRWRVPTPRIVAAAGMALFLCTGMFDAYDGPLMPLQRTLGYTLGSALTLAGLVQAERSGLIQPAPWLVYLGNASYAIYLIHFPALSVLAKIAKAVQLDEYLPGTVLFCLLAAGAIGAGCLFHHVVENPLHTWTKRFFRRAKLVVALELIADPGIRKDVPPAPHIRKAA